YERLRALAVTWLERAADLAVGRYDIDDALANLHRAVALESDRAALSRLWRAIGHANALKFDGEAFWTAMQRAIELDDGTKTGELYSQLAFHTSIRMGMWKTKPDQSLINGWIERALELTEKGSSDYVRALIAM